MPTYDYRCPNGHAFEVFKKMSEAPGSICPECGEMAERQISGGAGFLFKGDGFYITDSRSKDYRKKADAESGVGGADSASSGGSKTASEPGGSSGSDSTSPAPKTTESQGRGPQSS
jgi:putative FmdB family regulatory protein